MTGSFCEEIRESTKGYISSLRNDVCNAFPTHQPPFTLSIWKQTLWTLTPEGAV